MSLFPLKGHNKQESSPGWVMQRFFSPPFFFFSFPPITQWGSLHGEERKVDNEGDFPSFPSHKKGEGIRRRQERENRWSCALDVNSPSLRDSTKGPHFHAFSPNSRFAPRTHKNGGETKNHFFLLLFQSGKLRAVDGYDFFGGLTSS